MLFCHCQGPCICVKVYFVDKTKSRYGEIWIAILKLIVGADKKEATLWPLSSFLKENRAGNSRDVEYVVPNIERSLYSRFVPNPKYPFISFLESFIKPRYPFILGDRSLKVLNINFPDSSYLVSLDKAKLRDVTFGAFFNS